MKIELDNFIIESDIFINYFDDIVNCIVENEKRILSFFKLEKLPKKVIILILSYDTFKDFIVSKYGEILSYVCGDSDSKTNTIRILNIEDQIKYTIHKDACVEVIKNTALHEIVHQCHHVYHTDYRQTIWFSEGLANNISNQKYNLISLDECDFDKLQNDFRHYHGSYRFSYTITNYILNNYSEEEIEKLYKDPDYVRKKADEIFDGAKIWVNNILNSKSIKK